MSLFKRNRGDNGFLRSYKNSYGASDANERILVKEEFYVVGIVHYMKNINKLRIANPEYRKRKDIPIMKHIFKYSYINKPVKLIPEPTNPHDRNAVQVIIAGELVGYIGRDENAHVKQILKRKEIKYISSFISGGEYKVVSENGEAVRADNDLSIKITIAYVK